METTSIPETTTGAEFMGKLVRDRVTGYRGVVMDRCLHINGCLQLLVVPPVTSEGKYPERVWMDWQRLEIISDGPEINYDRSELDRTLLGCMAEDVVTGFRGRVVVVSCDFLGAVDLALKPALQLNGKLEEAQYVPIARCRVYKNDRVEMGSRPTGAEFMDDMKPGR